MIAGTTMYSENLIGIKLNTPVRKVVKPFFIGFAILDMSKHIIYDFYYNVLKTTFDNVELLGQDTELLGPIFKNEHNGYPIFEFVGLRPKMYCLVDEKHGVVYGLLSLPQTAR